MTEFVCDECGHRFEAMDIEWRASLKAADGEPVSAP